MVIVIRRVLGIARKIVLGSMVLAAQTPRHLAGPN